MSQHITLTALLAKNRGGLTPERERRMLEHMKHCRQCAELEEAVTLLRKLPVPQSQRPSQATSACPELETLANYYNGRFFFFRRRKIQKHIASCHVCREALVELAQLETVTLDDEDEAFLATRPSSLNVPLRPQAMPARRKENSTITPPRRTLQIAWAKLKASFAHHPVPAYALLVLVLTAAVGLTLTWPLVQRWQSNDLAQEGMQQLARDHAIPLHELRPAGPFQPQLPPSVHGSIIPTPNHDSAKKFEQSLDLNSENRTALRGQALEAYFNEDFEAAKRILLALHSRFPQEADIANDLGVVTARLRTPEEALPYFDRALALRPDFIAARYNRAHLLQKLDRRAEAQKAWQSYLDLHEGSDWQRLAEQQRDKLLQPLPKKN